ncbi:hypothetical protein BGX23_004366 [Mortierella sp. AD031]|nr:hypothetical protein BGX23_004366 [Mortierella sp. AD031]
MSARRGTPIVPFENYQPGAQHPQTMSAVGNTRVYEQVQQQPATPTSPTSPFAYAQPGGSQSPMDSVNFSSHGFLSPTRSPSRRAAQRTQFPVMSHAEQEEERCYHHYHGNQLPEPAGQKKLRSSSSLTEAYEEYGEGCMVFIE